MVRIALLAISLFAFQAHADAFRCGTRLVVEGDTRPQVRAKCGEPEDIETRTALRRPIVWLRGRPVFVGDGLIEVTVESWTYNLGPRKLMRRVKFVNGRVAEIETLTHGYLQQRLSGRTAAHPTS